MQKEILIAIVLGLVVGMSITYGLYRARTAETGSGLQELAELTQLGTDDTNEPAYGQLIIISPIEGEIVADATFTVTGSTFPNGIVVLTAHNQDYFTSADTAGNFSLDLELPMGATILTVTGLSSSGESVSIRRSIARTDLYTRVFNAQTEDSDAE
jgi:Flp pilus assembly protein TadG